MEKFLHRWNINVRSAYFRILVSTITITLIPLLLMYVFIYRQTVQVLEQESETIDTQLLTKTQENAELTLSRMQMNAAGLANSRDAIQFVFSLPVRDWTVVSRLSQDLASMAEYDKLIDSAYAYSANNGMLVTSDNRYYKTGEFYDQSWLPYYEEGDAQIHWTQPRDAVRSDGASSTCISLIVHVPSRSRKLSGAIVLNLDLDNMDTALLSGSLQQSSGGVTDILDQDLCSILDNVSDQTLEQVDPDWFASQSAGSRSISTDEGRCLLTYTYSSALHWYFIRLSPLGVLPNVYQTVGKFLLPFLIIFVLAFILAVRVSRLLYRPIQQLLEDVTGRKLNKAELPDEYGAIHAEYSRMQKKTTALESEITALQPLIRERFLLRLLRGQAKAPEQALAQFGFGPGPYAVFMVRCLPPRRPDNNSDLRYFQARTRIEELLAESIGFRSICAETNGDTITALIEFKSILSPAAVRQQLLDLSRSVRKTLLDELHSDAVTGFSPSCRTVGDIPGAYAAALKSVRFKLFQNSDAVLEDEDLLSPYAPLLQDLLEQISAGEENYVRAALDELFLAIRQNLENLSQFQIQQLATHILNSIIGLLIQNKLSTEQVFGEKRNLFAELQQRDDLNAISSWMERICLQCAGELALINTKQSNQRVLRMREYIEQHSGEDISLNDVAEWVGLSPSYVSRTFKESTGQNFIEYLNICRVGQAKQLLRDTQMSIKEIGFTSGFNSMQTFIRTFRKYENCTPSQFREQA